MKNKLLTLLKIQLKMSFMSGSGANTKRRGGKMKPGAYMALMAFVYLVLAFVVWGFCKIMVEGLHPVGMASVMPALMMAVASIMCLITTVYKTSSTLFAFSDYDMVMAMPIKTSTIVTSRMVILYSMNILFTLVVMVPALIVYASYVPAGALYWLMAVVFIILIPLVPIVIATIIGSLIAVAASYFKRRNGLSTVFTIIFFLIWMLFCFNMTNIASGMVDIGADVVGVLARIYPMTTLFESAVSQADVVAFLLFVVISIAVFAAFVAVVGRNFKRIHTTITTNRTISNYKMSALKQLSPKKALFMREFKRFTSSSTYLLNTGIGAIMLLAVSVILLIMGGAQLESLLRMPGLTMILTNASPFVISIFVALTCTTACSVSLEGKRLWIIKSLPVSTKDVLKAKLNVNLRLLIVTIAISSTIFAFVLKLPPLSTLMLYVTPLAYAYFTSLFGLRLNLSYPKFDWNSEVRAIKQSMPTMVVLLVGMAISIVPVIFSFNIGGFDIGSWLVYAVSAALIVIDIALYRNIMTKGVQAFESF